MFEMIFLLLWIFLFKNHAFFSGPDKIALDTGKATEIFIDIDFEARPTIRHCILLRTGMSFVR